MGTPGSDPVQGYNVYIFIVFNCYHKSWDRVI